MKCRSDKQTIVQYLWYYLVLLISHDQQQLFLNGQSQRNFHRNHQRMIMMKESNIGTDSKGFNCWFGRIADQRVFIQQSKWNEHFSFDRSFCFGKILASTRKTRTTTYVYSK